MKGWHNDSYRHSLAARGVRSSFVVRHIKERYYNDLINAGWSSNDIDDFESINNSIHMKEYKENLKLTDPDKFNAMAEADRLQARYKYITDKDYRDRMVERQREYRELPGVREHIAEMSRIRRAKNHEEKYNYLEGQE